MPTRRRFLLGAAAAAATPDVALAGLRCGAPDYTGLETCTASLRTEVRSVFALSAVEQHRLYWCWAACIEMILAHAGHPVRQERVVAETFGRPEDLPADTAQLLAALNRVWVDDHGVRVRVAAENLLWNAAWLADPSPPAARQLAEDHPLLIGTMGHTMVLTSVTWPSRFGVAGPVSEVVVRDPWPDPARPTGIRHLSTHEWLATTLLAWVHVAPA